MTAVAPAIPAPPAEAVASHGSAPDHGAAGWQRQWENARWFLGAASDGIHGLAVHIARASELARPPARNHGAARGAGLAPMGLVPCRAGASPAVLPPATTEVGSPARTAGPSDTPLPGSVSPACAGTFPSLRSDIATLAHAGKASAGMPTAGRPQAPPPLHVHVENSGAGLHIWLGAHAHAGTNVTATAGELLRLLQSEGRAVARIVCNGKTLYAIPTAPPPTFREFP